MLSSVNGYYRLTSPLVAVTPRVPDPDQMDLLGRPGVVGLVQLNPEDPGDGVGVALDQAVLVSLVRPAPVALPGAGDESLGGE